MITFSPLHLSKSAGILMVANTPTYVVHSFLEDGYVQTLARRFSSGELVKEFGKAAGRAQFEHNDDVVMMLTMMALALQGEIQAIRNLPVPKVKPRFFDEAVRILPQIIPKTRSDKLSLVKTHVVDPRKKSGTPVVYQQIQLQEFQS
jgi:hypothetical protein